MLMYISFPKEIREAAIFVSLELVNKIHLIIASQMMRVLKDQQSMHHVEELNQLSTH